MNCKKCKKERDLESFIKGNKQYTNCLECRNSCKEWRENNKERVSLYNKSYNDAKIDNTEITYVYARKYNTDEEWLQFTSQLDAAKQLGLYAPNINKVIKGILKTTGGYEFKLEKEIYKSTVPEWEEIKKEQNIIDKCKGQPSNHRILHETINDVIGKKCCSCKEWKALTDYNYSKSHWDNLRNDCKVCLVKWRKENREILTKKQLVYEKNRKTNDPQFKLLGTLRSRLGNALKIQNAKKCNTTMELTGCSVTFLKGYLEAKFKEGMTWENHGEWHIDHIKPCASFNLLDEKEQNACFHYTNLQPLWKTENLSKGSKYEK